MGKWDKMQPGEIRDCGHSEHVLLQSLYVLDSRLQESNLLKNRCAAVKGGWRDLCMVRAVTRKLLKNLLNTLPDKRLRQFDALRDHGWLNITVDATGLREKRKGQLPVEIEDMNCVAYFACNAECSMCLRDGNEIKQCPLRKALVNMMPPTNTQVVGCEYRAIIEAMSEMEGEGA